MIIEYSRKIADEYSIIDNGYSGCRELNLHPPIIKALGLGLELIEAFFLYSPRKRVLPPS